MVLSSCCLCSKGNGFSCSASFPEPPFPKIDIKEGNTADVAEPDCRGILIDCEIDMDLLLLDGKAKWLLSTPSGLTGEYF